MKRTIVKLIVLAVLTLCSAWSVPTEAAEEQETASGPGAYLGDRAELVDLREYLVIAAENSNELRAAFEQWQAAIHRAAGADTLPDPRFTFGYFIEPVETRSGPQRYKYGLSQTLPFFGKLGLKEEAALSEADGFKAKFDDTKLKTFFEVKRVYYEYAYLARAIEITRENIELMKYLETIATSRYTTGAARHADIIRPQVELGKLEDRLLSLEDLRRPLAARINALLDRPDETEVPLPGSVPVMVIAEDDEELLDEMLSANPQLRYWETETGKAEARTALARRDYFPDVTFGVETIETDDARSPNAMSDGDNPIIASMSFNIPIWFEARAAAVDEGAAQARAARYNRAGLARKLTADLELALYKYRDAGRKIDLYRDTLVPKAEQALGVTLEAFMTGQGTALDLVDSEQTLLELQLAYYRALADQAQRLAEIETLVGRELPCTFHGSLLGSTENQ